MKGTNDLLIDGKELELQRLAEKWAANNLSLNDGEYISVRLKIAKRKPILPRKKIVRLIKSVRKLRKKDWQAILSLPFQKKLDKLVMGCFKEKRTLTPYQVGQALEKVMPDLTIYDIVNSIQRLNSLFCKRDTPYRLKKVDLWAPGHFFYSKLKVFYCVPPSARTKKLK